ncbi:uncharacterized protein O3C94_010861 isoform 2-T3 [Discoglossus pictus]
MNKDKNKMEKMTERIVNHALQIIFLLTGEEYTIVKKNSPHSSTRQLTGEAPIKCDDVAVCFSMEEWEYIEGHKEIFKDVETPQTTKASEFPGKRSSGNHGENLYNVSLSMEHQDEREERDTQQAQIDSVPYVGLQEENLYREYEMEERDIQQVKLHSDVYTGLQKGNLYREYEREERDIQQVKLHSDVCAASSTVKSTVFSNIDKGELNMSGQQPVKEEQIPVNISKGLTKLHEENLRIVTLNEKGQYETKEKAIQPVEIHPDPCAGPSNVKPVFSKSKQREELNVRSQQLFKEEVIAVHIGEDGSMDRTIPEQHHNLNRSKHFMIGDKNMTKMYAEAIHVNAPSKNGNKSVENMVTEFICTDCGKSFSQNRYLIKHQRCHTAEKHYLCNQCGKYFSQQSNLIIHQRIHTREKPYVCSQCGKCFSQNATLVQHQKVHTVHKPFSCSECGKGFSQKSTLFKHQRIHTGVKPFVCSQCGKCYSQQSDLVNHQRNHTGEKPFGCSECGKCFSRKSVLVRHQSYHKAKFKRFHIREKEFQ